jgi:hypothetical protein
VGEGGCGTPQCCNIAVFLGNFNDSLSGNKICNLEKNPENITEQLYNTPPPLATNFGKRNIN